MDFHWGLPVSGFNDSVSWSTRVHSPQTRREQFLSWPWLRWKAGPFPGGLVWRHFEYLSKIRWHFVTAAGILQHVQTGQEVLSELLPEIDLRLQLENISRRQYCFCFGAECAQIEVGRTALESGHCYDSRLFKIGVRHNNTFVPFCTRSWNSEWRQSRLDKLEFMLLEGRRMEDPNEVKDERHETLILMLIETSEDRISYRIQIVHEAVNPI